MIDKANREILMSFTDSEEPKPLPLDAYKVIISAVESYEKRYAKGGKIGAPDVFFKILNVISTSKDLVHKFLISTNMDKAYYSIDYEGTVEVSEGLLVIDNNLPV